MGQEAISESIRGLSRKIEKLGSQFPLEVLSQLIESCGGKLVGPTRGGRIYKLPIVENQVIILVKKRKLSLYLGEEIGYGYIDVSLSAKNKIFKSYGKPTLERLTQLKRTLKSIDSSTAMLLYIERAQQEKLLRKLRRDKLLPRKITKRRDIGPTIVLKQIKPPTKVEITEQDLSFYEGSGIDFRHLLNSGDHVIRSWAQELYTLRKDIEDRDAYISQLKELHSKVSNYHSEKCRGKPPTNCAWTCDVWKLLHLCLYLMDESN